MNSDIVICPASASDFPQIHELLTICDLPLDGLEPHLVTALVACQDDALVGSVALEFYTKCALLRSLAVAREARGRGLGKELTTAALQLARENGVSRVYLLTETAADFFPKFGFQVLARDQVPAQVRQSVEFTTACPESALAMALTL